MDFSDMIKKIRWELRLSQQALADQIGCKQNTISAYELGIRSPNYSILKKIDEFARKNNLDIKLL